MHRLYGVHIHLVKPQANLQRMDTLEAHAKSCITIRPQTCLTRIGRCKIERITSVTEHAVHPNQFYFSHPHSFKRKEQYLSFFLHIVFPNNLQVLLSAWLATTPTLQSAIWRSKIYGFRAPNLTGAALVACTRLLWQPFEKRNSRVHHLPFGLPKLMHRSLSPKILFCPSSTI